MILSRKHVLGVLFYLGKTYSATYKQGILFDPHAIGFLGCANCMLIFNQWSLNHHACKFIMGPESTELRCMSGA